MKLVRHCKALYFVGLTIVVLTEHCRADHYDARRDLHSEVQGIPVALEPRKKSPRPLTSVGALSATVLKSLRPLTSVRALGANFVSTTATAKPEDSIGGGTPIGCSYNVKAQTARLSAIDSSDDFI